MKHILYTFICLLLALCSFTAPDDAVYKLIKSKRDRSLENDKTGFNFHFEDSHGKVIQNEIRITCNGQGDWVEPDKNGDAPYITKAGPCVLTFFYNKHHYTIKTDTIFTVTGYRTSIELKFQPSVAISW
ncbi:MAG TPA: hypothetical protein VK177_08400 [Flavobacteriales bacterium]|nr:hypothetical protein [Flavobacteriales bacterium]